MERPSSFAQLYKETDQPVYSFEFFPPRRTKDLHGTKRLISHLAELNPDFMTVTYGAGGTTRQHTTELVSYINNNLDVTAVAHLTCVGHSVNELNAILDSLAAVGINHIMALRGDPPRGTNSFTPHPEGLACARDLVKHIKQRGGFTMAVAGYPETHPEALSPEADIAYLRDKVDAGAEVIITQIFFDAQMYQSFTARARKAGITIPIVPGVMPIFNVRQIERISDLCKASIPDQVSETMHQVQDDPEAVIEFGTSYALQLCQDLLSLGAPGIHFYTLNKSNQTERILLSLRN